MSKILQTKSFARLENSVCNNYGKYVLCSSVLMSSLCRLLVSGQWYSLMPTAGLGMGGSASPLTWNIGYDLVVEVAGLAAGVATPDLDTAQNSNKAIIDDADAKVTSVRSCVASAGS